MTKLCFPPTIVGRSIMLNLTVNVIAGTQ